MHLHLEVNVGAQSARVPPAGVALLLSPGALSVKQLREESSDEEVVS